ncbi:MAG: amino acid ABC transporter permease [Acidobacteria bacterium]|nr:amino acid ABC transporter permease [Acidobacteriota bacterium]
MTDTNTREPAEVSKTSAGSRFVSRKKPGRFSGLLGQSGSRGALVAFGSTVLFVVLTVVVVVNSDAWPKVQNQFLNWEHFKLSFPDIVGAFWLDMRMFVIAEVLILSFALLVAVLRVFRGPAFTPLRVLSIVYIDLFRGVPLILVLFLLGFGIPALDLPGVPNGAMFWGVTALVLSYSAYTAEVYRSGLESVHESQRAAARALGLGQWQALRFAILPQAIRNVVPALLNGLVSLQKDVALISVLGVREAVRQAEIYKARTFNYTSLLVAALLFLIVSVPVARFADWYTARDRRARTKGLQ